MCLGKLHIVQAVDVLQERLDGWIRPWMYWRQCRESNIPTRAVQQW